MTDRAERRLASAGRWSVRLPLPKPEGREAVGGGLRQLAGCLCPSR